MGAANRDGSSPPRGNSPDERVSQSPGSFMYAAGGVGYIARRGLSGQTNASLLTMDGIIRLSTQQPLYLLSLLPDIVPEVGLAAWNGQRLGCSDDRVRIKAVVKKADGSSEEAPDGTAAIDSLFNNLPDEAGSFADLLSKNFLMTMFSGMCACEAVLAPRNQGVAEVWPVNSLTLRFMRVPPRGLILQQRQSATTSQINVAGLSGNYIDMPMDRFFWASMDGFPDDVYGRAPLAPALTATLECLAFMRDLLTAFHRVGLPRLDVSFDFEMWATLARDVLGMTDAAGIDKWVQGQFQKSQQLFNSLKQDDAFFHDTKSSVGTVGSGDKWPDVPGLWNIFRHRLTQALKQNPVLMGVVEGSTETWSDVQWELYTEGLLSIVKKAVQPLVRVAQLHLRLLGLPYTAEVDFLPVRSLQRLNEANAEAQEIANEQAKVQNNWQTNITASQKVTGSAPPSPQQIADDVAPKAAAAPALPGSPMPPLPVPPIPPVGGKKPNQDEQATKSAISQQWRDSGGR